MRSGTFFKQADLYLDSLKKSGKFNCHSADKPRIERFKEFLGGSDIAFSEINPALIKRFGAVTIRSQILRAFFFYYQ